MKCRFEIVGLSGIDGVPMHLKINGKSKYMRILIKKVKEEDIKEPKDVALLMQYNKKFLIIGNGNAVTYKEIFPLIKENKMWLGAGKGMGGKAVEFMVDENIYDASKGSVNRIENGICYVGVMMVTWFTNLDHFKRHQEIDLYKHYNAEEYPKYDNYDAIEVSKTCEIPMDYDGIMGVPISFFDKYCPQQFEIVGNTCLYDKNSIRTKVYTSEECIEAYFNMFGKEGCYPMNSGPMLRKNGFLFQSYKRILIKRVSKNNFN